MSVANPETMSEWMEHVSIITENEILSKARAANSPRFIEKMLEEGFELAEVKTIIQALARRCGDFNLQPPRGVYDMPNMLTTKAVQDMKLPDPATVEWEPEPDEIDRDIDQLDLETEWEATAPL